jgi:hypothetical protein
MSGSPRWEADGTWARLLEHVQVRDDAVGHLEWTVSVDSTVNRAHQHAAGARKKGIRTGTRRFLPGACRKSGTGQGSGQKVSQVTPIGCVPLPWWSRAGPADVRPLPSA